MQVSVPTPSRTLRLGGASAPPGACPRHAAPQAAVDVDRNPPGRIAASVKPASSPAGVDRGSLGTSALGPVLAGLARYHAYTVDGLERVPRQGGALIVVNHSLATYDIGLLGRAIETSRGRTLRMLGDRLIFKLPGLRDLARSAGVLEAKPDAALQLLRQGELVGVAPGGMMEALRPTSDAYEIQWEGRRGFARLALQAQVPIVLAACPSADNLYDVYENPLTRWVYERTRLPLPIATGRFGITLLPKKVTLRHVLSDPIYPPKLPRPDAKPGDADYEAILNGFHQQLIASMESLMAQARTSSPASGPVHASLQRWAQEVRAKATTALG